MVELVLIKAPIYTAGDNNPGTMEAIMELFQDPKNVSIV